MESCILFGPHTFIRLFICLFIVGRYSDSLRSGRSRDRIPVGARFFAPRTACGAHPASYKMGTGYLSRGVKRPGRGVDHPPSSSAEVKERVELSIPLLPLCAFMACYRVNFTFIYLCIVAYLTTLVFQMVICEIVEGESE
jgi:hypothetical protein